MEQVSVSPFYRGENRGQRKQRAQNRTAEVLGKVSRSSNPRALTQAPECFPLCRAAAQGHTSAHEALGQAGSVSAGPRRGGGVLGAPPRHPSSTSQPLQLRPGSASCCRPHTHNFPTAVPPGGSGKLPSNAAKLKSRVEAGAACSRGSFSARRMLRVRGAEGTRLRNSRRRPVGVHQEPAHLPERPQGAVSGAGAIHAKAGTRELGGSPSSAPCRSFLLISTRRYAS